MQILYIFMLDLENVTYGFSHEIFYTFCSQIIFCLNIAYTLIVSNNIDFILYASRLLRK